MKKAFFALLAITSMTMGAQNINDALRYSTSDLTGTARFRAMSGAFGALGGDLSAIDVNPAGSAVFLNSTAAFSLDFAKINNDVSYFDGVTNNSLNNFNVGQAGAAFVFNSTNADSPWRKFTFGVNYSTSRNFDDNFTAFGTGNTSISNYFLGYANGVPLDFLEPLEGESIAELYTYLGENQGFGAQQALLGYQGFVINSDDPGNMDATTYSSAIGPGTFDQEYAFASTGLNGKISFNFATQYGDNLYLGLNLNSHFLNYDKMTNYQEINDNPGSETHLVYFENSLSTLGSGFSFQVGGLGKLGRNIRLGASYESPTWFTISEETTDYLERGLWNSSGDLEVTDFVNPGVVNVYPDYKLQTPGKFTGSFAYLFGPNGLISFDYSYKDYASTKFKPSNDPDFSIENDIIADQLKAASTFRVGGEYRITGWSLRAGYRFEESPYKNDNIMGNLTGYSLGVGYDFGNLRLDLAYDTAVQERNHQFFPAGMTEAAFIDSRDSNVILTLGFGL